MGRPLNVFSGNLNNKDYALHTQPSNNLSNYQTKTMQSSGFKKNARSRMNKSLGASTRKVNFERTQLFGDQQSIGSL